MTEQTIEVRKLADLKRNPHQEEFFGADDENGILELAADIEQRGLQTLPMILPNYTIISGHQRWRRSCGLVTKNVAASWPLERHSNAIN